MINDEAKKGMYNRCKESYADRYAQWRESFQSLAAELKSYEFSPMTRAAIDELQYKVDTFIEINDININVSVIAFDQTVQFVGRTLEDNLVWESIQRDDIKITL